MKLLFIDHEFHRVTRSADFFTDILKKAFAVTEHSYADYYCTGAKRMMQAHDIAVVWEFPVSRGRFFFPGKRNVFVPMYDNEWGSFWQWRRIAWSGMGVVSFCAKVSAHARRCGVRNLLDVRYFPDPKALPQEAGDPKRVFLWERGGVSRKLAEQLFPPSAGYVIDVKGAQELLPRSEYLERLSKCGIVIAPRRKEGIGMAFLEAMAMGKCVVAYNDATMNEYITDGKSGVLFSGSPVNPVDAAKIARVRENLPRAVARYRARWLADAAQINGFMQGQRVCRPGWSARLKLILSYPLYLAEGALWRLRHE